MLPGQPTAQSAACQRAQAQQQLAASPHAPIGHAIALDGSLAAVAALYRLKAATDAFHVLPGLAMLGLSGQPALPALLVLGRGLIRAQQGKPFGGLFQRVKRGLQHIVGMQFGSAHRGAYRQSAWLGQAGRLMHGHVSGGMAGFQFQAAQHGLAKVSVHHACGHA